MIVDSQLTYPVIVQANAYHSKSGQLVEGLNVLLPPGRTELDEKQSAAVAEELKRSGSRLGALIDKGRVRVTGV